MSLKIPIDLDTFNKVSLEKQFTCDIVKIEISEVIVREHIVILDIYFSKNPEVVGASRRYTFYATETVSVMFNHNSNYSSKNMSYDTLSNIVYLNNLITKYYPELLIV